MGGLAVVVGPLAGALTGAVVAAGALTVAGGALGTVNGTTTVMPGRLFTNGDVGEALPSAGNGRAVVGAVVVGEAGAMENCGVEF